MGVETVDGRSGNVICGYCWFADFGQVITVLHEKIAAEEAEYRLMA